MDQKEKSANDNICLEKFFVMISIPVFVTICFIVVNDLCGNGKKRHKKKVVALRTFYSLIIMNDPTDFEKFFLQHLGLTKLECHALNELCGCCCCYSMTLRKRRCYISFILRSLRVTINI
ncbi:CLUMA_CG001374, isoform A [Clunio marinus]|uniref:CLUMA_CG001374, isoform A n=1 Tax=Clunio marinus TaxID=568069 RepID=A0A1J1HMW6_9DIPT|nr:CLUMA_CG001374, isoform A [Clunio marinus]